MTAVLCWLVLYVVNCLALNTQSNLESAWLSTITGQSHIETSGPISYDFAQGRATNYAYNQAGSCGCARLYMLHALLHFRLLS